MEGGGTLVAIRPHRQDKLNGTDGTAVTANPQPSTVHRLRSEFRADRIRLSFVNQRDTANSPPGSRASMRFIHAADLHLDSPLRGVQDYHGAPVT